MMVVDVIFTIGCDCGDIFGKARGRSMEMRGGRILETVVGFAVLLVTLIFADYVYNRSGWKKIDGFTLTAKFNKIDGLAEGTDVKMSGVRVGKISKIAIDPKSFMAIVTFSVSKDIKLPKDSSASITSDGLFGGKYLSLIPGGDEKILKDGEFIKYTTGPLSLESLIAKMMFSNNNKKE
jgi:phospholipid/cholesterol/gamma-HCH transport system substrate-binding protein